MASYEENILELDAVEISDVAGRSVDHKCDDIAFARAWAADRLA